MSRRKLLTFTCHENMKFGDYILFQEYKQAEHNGKQYLYKISRPTMAIYLGCFVADQTIGFNYVKWNNDNHSEFITNEHVTNYRVVKEVEEIQCHVEWDDCIDILGYWKNKPGWREILHAYRKQNINNTATKYKFEFFDDVED